MPIDQGSVRQRRLIPISPVLLTIPKLQFGYSTHLIPGHPQLCLQNCSIQLEGSVKMTRDQHIFIAQVYLQCALIPDPLTVIPIPVANGSGISCCPVQAGGEFSLQKLASFHFTIPCKKHRDLYYSGLYPQRPTSDPRSIDIVKNLLNPCGYSLRPISANGSGISPGS